jgi:hypothetical protein
MFDYQTSKHAHFDAACRAFALSHNLEDVAAAVGMRPQILRNKLNPIQPHRLTCDELLAIPGQCDTKILLCNVDDVRPEHFRLCFGRGQEDLWIARHYRIFERLKRKVPGCTDLAAFQDVPDQLSLMRIDTSLAPDIEWPEVPQDVA